MAAASMAMRLDNLQQLRTTHQHRFAVKMVVGKSTNTSLAKAVTAKPSPRLPTLPKLYVRNPNRTEQNPCLDVMTSVLGECIL